MEPPLRHNEEDLLFKGKNIHCRNEPLFKGCGNSLVYRGYFKEKENSKEEEIVVRKIKKTDCDDQWEDIFVKHTREEDAIKHDNVLRIISYEEKNEWRYFALEHYDFTLEMFCKGIYKGPIPSDAQVLCQITKGLLYLHGEKCTHGNLTPRTILIASSQPVRMMIKLSEFGLSKFSGQCDEELEEKQELCQRKYWILNGTIIDTNQTPTPNHDIFAAGCVCFYFLKRGVHPFGSNTSSILENIKKGNPVNLLTSLKEEKGLWEFAYEPIKNMIGDPPNNGTNWLMIAKKSFKKALSLKVDRTKVLGSGSYGKVYKGTFEGNAVAVKIFKEHSDDAIKPDQKREMEEHFRLDHKNVLKLFHLDEIRNQTCLVLELCAGTLKDYCEKKKELPPDGLVLYQIANGLHYIHSRGLVHRDIKPENILISMTTPVQIKLSDFGFVKKTSPRGTFDQKSGIKGTLNWMAPEILEHCNYTSTNNLPRGTIQSDTFAAGCAFFYVLTRGKHPFDKPTIIGKSSELPDNSILNNIKKNIPKALNIEQKQNLQGDDRALLYELIGKMIKPIEDRISLPDVIKQLTAKLDASRQFLKFENSRKGRYVCRFHPTEPVLACGGEDKLFLLSADNSSIPFSNWKGKENQLETGNYSRPNLLTIEWNVNGSQLAAVTSYGRDVIVWNYPSAEILFQKELDEPMTRIEWNPFRPNVLATFERFGSSEVVFFFNSCPVDQRQFHFYTIKHPEESIYNVQWISENRVALGLLDGGGIEIWEIDESTATAQIVKRFQHEKDTITDMAWDERTKCLAACSVKGWMRIWSMDSDQPIHATKVDGTCLSLAWRPNGKQTDDDEGVEAARKSADNFILAADNFIIADGLWDGEIVIWTPLAEEKTRILSQHPRWVLSLSFSPDGRFLASADYEGKLNIWSTENWKPVYIGQGEYMTWLGKRFLHPTYISYIGEELRRGDRFSWSSSSSTDVPDYKLTFDSYGATYDHVVEYAVVQSENPSKDGSETNKWIAEEKETPSGANSSESYSDLK